MPLREESAKEEGAVSQNQPFSSTHSLLQISSKFAQILLLLAFMCRDFKANNENDVDQIHCES